VSVHPPMSQIRTGAVTSITSQPRPWRVTVVSGRRRASMCDDEASTNRSGVLSNCDSDAVR
jgi:hypothetical protein